jgi:hypothetical protein
MTADEGKPGRLIAAPDTLAGVMRTLLRRLYRISHQLERIGDTLAEPPPRPRPQLDLVPQYKLTLLFKSVPGELQEYTYDSWVEAIERSSRLPPDRRALDVRLVSRWKRNIGPGNSWAAVDADEPAAN